MRRRLGGEGGTTRGVRVGTELTPAFRDDRGRRFVIGAAVLSLIAWEIPALIDHARAGGLAVELRMRGDLAQVAPSVGVALYRIAQEALANAARHAPHARTVLALELRKQALTA